MRNRSESGNAVADLVRFQQEEIERYLWIESEKVGHDIGWKKASQDWEQKHFTEWKRHLHLRGFGPPVFEVLSSQQKEIESYKWIESEKTGRDIGWKRAVTEWHDRHYGQWREHALDVSLEDRSPETKPAATTVITMSGRRSSRRAFSDEHRQNLALAMRAWHERKQSSKTDKF
jgi:hypothetical protein